MLTLKMYEGIFFLHPILLQEELHMIHYYFL
jgi:hypothetical protein